jgi:hypothetical protein
MLGKVDIPFTFLQGRRSEFKEREEKESVEKDDQRERAAYEEKVCERK